MRWLLVMLLVGVVAPASAQAPASGGITYHVARKIPIGGEGSWDYLTYDAVRHRLFLSHATQVEVVDEASGNIIGRIPETPGVHGIALAQDHPNSRARRTCASSNWSTSFRRPAAARSPTRGS